MAKELRLVTLNDGEGMGDEMLICETNAPVEILKEIEKESCEVLKSGGAYEDIPIWSEALGEMGFIFNVIDSHQHINPFATSISWREEQYPEAKNEEYTITL